MIEVICSIFGANPQHFLGLQGNYAKKNKPQLVPFFHRGNEVAHIIHVTEDAMCRLD
jgi:hypothetical protein